MSEENNIPKHWQAKKLGEVCEILPGYGFPKNLQGSKSGKFPFYKVGDISKNVKAGNRQLELCDNFIDEKTLLKLKAKPYPKNTIVFAKIGEGLKLNRRAIINTPGIVDNNAIGLKAIENICDDLFLYNFLTTVKLEDYSKATTVPSVRKSEIEEIYFPLPPLPEQQAIVSKIEELLSDLENGKQQLQTAQQQLKIYRQSLLKWAFEGRLTHKNYISELSKEWKWAKLVDVCVKVETVKRKEKNPEEELLYLDIGGIDNSTNKIRNHKTYKWKDAPSRAQQIVFVEDVLFSTVRTYLKNIAFVENKKFNGQIASSGFCVIRGNKKIINPKFIFYYSISQMFLQPLNELQTGSSYPAVRDKDVYSQPIPLPPLSEQELVVQELESKLTICDKVEETINDALQKSETLRQSILQKAFSGQLVTYSENHGNPTNQIKHSTDS